jgi:hypothetical protein
MDGFVRTRIVEHTEWVLPSPTYIGEVLKAVRGAQKLAADRGVNVNCDDWLTVSGDGDSVILSLATERDS